jgi:hypothetical protein
MQAMVALTARSASWARTPLAAPVTHAQCAPAAPPLWHRVPPVPASANVLLVLVVPVAACALQAPGQTLCLLRVLGQDLRAKLVQRRA